MTKIYINTNNNKNITMQYLASAERALANAKYYFNQLFIPDEYVNKNYLNWFMNELAKIQDNVYDIRNTLSKANQRFEYRYNLLQTNISGLKKTKIEPRKGVVK